MAECKIRCEAIKIRDGMSCCPGSAKTKMGEVFTLGVKTPEPRGMCARAFAAIYPAAMALMFSEDTSREGNDFFDITCPDSYVTFRLTRLKELFRVL